MVSEVAGPLKPLPGLRVNRQQPCSGTVGIRLITWPQYYKAEFTQGSQTRAAPQQKQGPHCSVCLVLRHIHGQDHCGCLEATLVRIQMSLWGSV